MTKNKEQPIYIFCHSSLRVWAHTIRQCCSASDNTGQRLIHLLAWWWWCQSRLWTNFVAWQERAEDLQSYNHTIEAFVRFRPRCVSITVHLLITPSNPKALDIHVRLFISWRIIPTVKPMWGLISLHGLTSRATGFTTISDDYIPFLAQSDPDCTHSLQHSGTDFDDCKPKSWPQNCSHYSLRV